MKRSALQRQRGVSLVEVAIASVILGACGILLWGVVDRQASVASADRSLSIVERAHDAILAYAYLHRELPCPSRVTTGLENCDGSSEGFLPYLTLGLPEPAAGKMRYRMALDTKSPASSDPYRVLTSQRTGRFGDLSAQLLPLSDVAPGGHEALFDLCRALGSPTRSAEMAYEIGSDIGAPVAGGSVGPAGLSPSVVQVIGRAQLAAKLQCGTLAAAGRAHFNAALAADTMNRAMEDIVAQAELVEYTYSVDTSQGVYFEVNSLYSLYRANIKRLGALAAAEASNGANSGALLLAQVNTAKAGAYTAALGVNVARFAINQEHGKLRRQTLNDIQAATKRAATEIRARAITGSSSAFFLEGKWSSPAP